MASTLLLKPLNRALLGLVLLAGCGAVGLHAEQGPTPAFKELQAWARDGRYQAVIDAIPASGQAEPARSLRWQCLRALGKFTQVVEESSKVEDTAAQLQWVAAALAVGQYKEAADKLAQMDAKNLSVLALHVRLARLQGKQQTWQRRIIDCYHEHRRAVLQPDAPVADIIAFMEIVGDQDPGLVLGLATRLHEHHPNVLEAYLLAADLCLQAFAWGEAKQETELGLAQWRMHPDLLTYAAQVHLASGRLAEAREALAKAVQIQAQHLRARCLLAKLALQDGHVQGARAHLQQAAQSNAQYPPLLALRCVLAELTGEKDALEKSLAAVAVVDASMRPAYAALTEQALGDGRLNRAQHWIAKALPTSRRDWWVTYLAGLTAMRRGDDKQAYKLLDRSFSINQFNRWAYQLLLVLDRERDSDRTSRIELEHVDLLVPTFMEAVCEPWIRHWLLQAEQRLATLPQSENQARLQIVVCPDEESFRIRQGGLAGLPGATAATTIALDPWEAGQGHTGDWHKQFMTRLVEVHVYRLSGWRAPQWLIAGIADWFIDAPMQAGQLALKEAIANQRWPAFVAATAPADDAVLERFVARLLVEHLVKADAGQNGSAQILWDLCGELRQEVDWEQVWLQRFGQPFAVSMQAHRQRCTDLAASWDMIIPFDPRTLMQRRQAAELNALTAEDWLRLAATEASMGLFEAARKAAEKALDIEDAKQRLQARYLLAEATWASQRDGTRATGELMTILGADPGHVASLLLGGRIAAEQQEYPVASAFFKQALLHRQRLTAAMPDPRIELIRLQQRSGAALDVAALQKALQDHPWEMTLRRTLARSLLDDQQAKQARPVVERLLQLALLNGDNLDLAKRCFAALHDDAALSRVGLVKAWKEAAEPEQNEPAQKIDIEDLQ